MHLMKLFTIPLLATTLFASAPFSVDATEDVSSQFPGAPRLQSFSFAHWEGRWVFIGGRTAGYHSVGGGTAEFLQSDANRDVWVVDTTVEPARSYHVSLDRMADTLAPVRAQWSSTAQLSYQDGPALYIAGGYGQDEYGRWITFPLISRVELPALIQAVMRGQLPDSAVTYARTPLTESAGGGLVKLDDGYFYLVMGHSFQGNYTAFEGEQEQNSQTVSQEYLSEIRKLSIVASSAGLEVRLVEKFRDEEEFHRRDLNVAQVLSPQGLGLAAYGGVFTPKTQLNYSKPVYLLPGSAPAVDTTFDQKMNAYSCAVLSLYDKTAGTMYTTLFGGISRYQWDGVRFAENPKSGSKSDSTYLDGLQWSDQISILQRVMTPGREQTTETVESKSMTAFVGANATFIPVEGLAKAHPATDILDIAPLRGTRTFVGYLYGGIQAKPYRFPYNKSAQPQNSGVVPTTTNGLILKVYLDVPGN